ncbi:ABC transporter substrate-binding protein [Sphingomonas sp.]|jgi:peptide/nickel transport system substrate-binding protein|uniref:ABC transporter substrate-binding protein n=1 Tax=Sphingomonas sp. TaxID=28214 RepID=UPI002D7F0CC1|nr:ABC transporter substrate-binding protein [Sphingomonas sp.]HEU0044432.1 ABC transporter substrate-binding protein [Sphingomonas sp.]
MLAGCGWRADTDPVSVSAIGSPPTLAPPRRTAAGTPSRLLTDAVAQGLVRFDAAGQIEPGLAERWIVIDDGASYIFRLREAGWADGQPVSAEQVVAQLRRQIAPGSRNPLLPFLSAIDEIVIMTPQVIEVRLSRPRPDLLKLFAQPELAILRAGRFGSGPMRMSGPADAPTLRPLGDPARPDQPGANAADAVRLRGDRAAVALARFAVGEVDLVAGGTFADWPLVVALQPRAAMIQVDPAAGLFGLLFVRREGFLADAANRLAIAQAIDEVAAVFAVSPDWTADPRLLPDRLDSAAATLPAPWAGRTMVERQAFARARVAAFRKPVTLRIGLPEGAGATRLWGQIARSLLLVGVTPERVAATAPADLRLLDAVAPYDSARWYLATACQPCGEPAQAALEAAREAPTLAERAQRIAEADAALAADISYIPLARPLRWSLVSPRLRAWRPNARAWHPLNRLRIDPN